MLYPAAGIILWLFFGGLVGFVASKVTRTDSDHGLMANLGVGALSAVIAGFSTTFFFGGERSTGGYWGSIAISLLAAVLGVTVFRSVYPRSVPTVR